MTIHWIFLLIAIITNAYLAQSLSTSVSESIPKFEYDVFRWAPNNGTCESFRDSAMNYQKMNDAEANTPKTLCLRFKGSSDCYNFFYSNLDLTTQSGKDAKADLDQYDITAMKNECPKAA